MGVGGRGMPRGAVLARLLVLAGCVVVAGGTAAPPPPSPPAGDAHDHSAGAHGGAHNDTSCGVCVFAACSKTAFRKLLRTEEECREEGDGAPGDTLDPPGFASWPYMCAEYRSQLGLPEEEDHHHDVPYTIITIFAAFALGAFIRHFTKDTGIPYTVLLFAAGMVWGALSRRAEGFHLGRSVELTNIDPHLIFHVFLPVLIFESAFAMEIPVFQRVLGQSVLLAIPGLMVCTAMIATVAKYVFTEYHWDWASCLLFGTILSATDPVAVVALLKELGASPLISTLIEGESLFNDGAAIVFFNILVGATKSESCREPSGEWRIDWDTCTDGCACEYLCELDKTVGDFAIELLRVSLGGVAVGLVMGMVTVPLYTRIVNDPMIEISLTIIAAYTTFFASEVFFHVSGVLGVVAVGCFYSYWRHSISPEVSHTLHEFWEICVYLANTMIFILAGMIVYLKAFDIADTEDPAARVTRADWLYLLITYIAINLARTIMLALFMPVLHCFEYKFTTGAFVLVSWGGLRGAVGLALALIVQADENVVRASVRHKFIFHVAGIVILTLVVNGVTTKYVVKYFELDKLEHRHKTRMHLIWNELLAERDLDMKDIRDNVVFVYDTNWKELARLTDLSQAIGKKGKTRDDPYNAYGWFDNRYAGMKDSEVQQLNRVDTTQAYLKSVTHSLEKQYMLGTVRRQGIRGLSKDLERLARVAEAVPEDDTEWLEKCFISPPFVSRWFQRQWLDTTLMHIPLPFIKERLVRWRLQNGFDIALATITAHAQAERGIRRWSDKATVNRIVRHCKRTRVGIVDILQREGEQRPDVAAALKTRTACRKVLHHMRETIDGMVHSSCILKDDAEVLRQMIREAEKRVTMRFPWTLLPATPAAILEQHTWFSNASPSTRRALAQYSRRPEAVKDVPADTPLASVVEPGNLVVVVVGILEVRAPGGRLLPFGAGHTTGWLALLTGRELFSNVATASRCKLLVLPGDKLRATLTADKQFHDEAWHACGQQTAQSLLTTHDNYGRTLPASTVRHLSHTGSVLFVQGETCDEAEKCRRRRCALRDNDDTIRVLLRGTAWEYDAQADGGGGHARLADRLIAPCVIPKTYRYATFTGGAVMYEMAMPLTASQRAILRWRRLRSKVKAIFVWVHLRGPVYGRNALATLFGVRPLEYSDMEEIERRGRILKRRQMSLLRRAACSSRDLKRKLSERARDLDDEITRLRSGIYNPAVRLDTDSLSVMSTSNDTQQLLQKPGRALPPTVGKGVSFGVPQQRQQLASSGAPLALAAGVPKQPSQSGGRRQAWATASASQSSSVPSQPQLLGGPAAAGGDENPAEAASASSWGTGSMSNSRAEGRERRRTLAQSPALGASHEYKEPTAEGKAGKAGAARAGGPRGRVPETKPALSPSRATEARSPDSSAESPLLSVERIDRPTARGGAYGDGGPMDDAVFTAPNVLLGSGSDFGCLPVSAVPTAAQPLPPARVVEQRPPAFPPRAASGPNPLILATQVLSNGSATPVVPAIDQLFGPAVAGPAPAPLQTLTPSSQATCPIALDSAAGNANFPGGLGALPPPPAAGEAPVRATPRSVAGTLTKMQPTRRSWV